MQCSHSIYFGSVGQKLNFIVLHILHLKHCNAKLLLRAGLICSLVPRWDKIWEWPGDEATHMWNIDAWIHDKSVKHNQKFSAAVLQMQNMQHNKVRFLPKTATNTALSKKKSRVNFLIGKCSTFKGSKVVKICNRIMFDFYLPQFFPPLVLGVGGKSYTSLCQL